MSKWPPWLEIKGNGKGRALAHRPASCRIVIKPQLESRTVIIEAGDYIVTVRGADRLSIAGPRKPDKSIKRSE